MKTEPLQELIEQAHMAGQIDAGVDPSFSNAQEYANQCKPLKALQAENAALQAKIDALMLEYCPDEMTPEQIENWAQNQGCILTENL